MNIKNINSIGESSFYSYSVEDTLAVLDVLEAQDWTNIQDKTLEENSSFCTRLLDIVDDRIHKNDYKELLDNDEEKNHVLLQVLRVRTNISQYRLLWLRNDVEKSVVEKVKSANEKFEQTENNINETVQTAQEAIQKRRNDVERDINEHLAQSQQSFEEQINIKIKAATDSIEPQLITTTLTLMGVFSAIITIIMSVVITSSSWLNNADGASAVVAFIVPSLVVAFSIAVLLGVVFTRRGGNYIIVSGNNWNHESVANEALKKVQRTQKCTVIFIVIFTLVSLVIAICEIRCNDKPHMRYVLAENMYECIEIEDDLSDETSCVIEFTFNEKNYRFMYNERYFHDGLIYFCEEHNRLE